MKKNNIFHNSKEEYVLAIDKEETKTILDMLRGFIRNSDAFVWRVILSKTPVRFQDWHQENVRSEKQDSKQLKME